MRNKSKPPPRACVECGEIGFRLKDICQRCSNGSPMSLNGRGDWVIDMRRRIVVWRKREAS